MTQPEEVPELLARAASGDEAAWREVVQRWSPRVFAFLRTYTRDPELAEEIVREESDAHAVECLIASRIGAPIDQPALFHLRVAPAPGATTSASAKASARARAAPRRIARPLIVRAMRAARCRADRNRAARCRH